MTHAWRDLEELAEREAVLVADGQIDELAALHARREELLAALPRPLPPEAAAPLQRALAAQRATATALAARRDAISVQLGRLNRGRAGVQGYARCADIRS